VYNVNLALATDINPHPALHVVADNPLGLALALAASGDNAPAGAWLSLDESDNDPLRFLAYLIAAMQQMDPRIGQTLQDLPGLVKGQSIAALVTILINDIMLATRTPSLSSQPHDELERSSTRPCT
jgi:hypothetical protein